MAETQESISQWAEETFGPSGSTARVAARVNEEMAELIRALTVSDDSPKAAEEAADVKIVLYRLNCRLGFPPLPRSTSTVTIARSNLCIITAAHLQMGDILNSLARMETSETSKFVMLRPEYGLHSKLRSLNRYLLHLAGNMGFNLDAEVDKKMAINRSRQWNLDKTGHGYHVRSEAERDVSAANNLS